MTLGRHWTSISRQANSKDKDDKQPTLCSCEDAMLCWHPLTEEIPLQVPHLSMMDLKALEPAVVRNALADLQSRFGRAIQVRNGYLRWRYWTPSPTFIAADKATMLVLFTQLFSEAKFMLQPPSPGLHPPHSASPSSASCMAGNREAAGDGEPPPPGGFSS